MVVCCKCREDKPEANYSRDRHRPNGLCAACKTCRREYARKWRTANPARHNENATSWQKSNPNAMAAIRRRYATKHKVMRNAVSREWQKRNRAHDAARSAEQRAAKKRATPAWASKAYIAMFYKLAADESVRTGRKVHVDHIVPLSSPVVCGLHVEHNLQLLFMEDNVAKRNRFPIQEGAPSQLLRGTVRAWRETA